MHHLNNGKSLLLLQLQQVTLSLGILMNSLSQTLTILTKFSNQKPSIFSDLVKICNQLVENVKICGFSDRTRWSDLIFAGGQIYPGKGPKKNQRAKPKCWGQQVLFGTKFLKFGPKGVNLATLTPMYSTVNCTSATRAYARGDFGVNPPPFSLLFYKNFITCAK